MADKDSLPPGTAQSYVARAGDQLNFTNEGEAAVRIKVVTACGTETLVDLHPGAKVQVTVGASPVRVDILGGDENYTGLAIVR
jgi:hypothetical protein